MPVIDFSQQDTTPGGGDLLSPPADFVGNYTAFLLGLFRSKDHRQIIALLANHVEKADDIRRKKTTITGPYRAEAFAGIQQIMALLREQRMLDAGGQDVAPRPEDGQGLGGLAETDASLRAMPDTDENNRPQGKLVLGRNTRGMPRSRA